MRFPPSWLDELRARADIVQIVGQYVQLKKNGRKYWGLCPFHGEKTASFSVDPEKQLFYCFGCKAGGSVIHFVMEIEHLPFPEAVKHLADQLHMPLPQMEADPDYQRRQTQRERLLACNRDAAHFFYETLFTPRAADAGLFEAPRRIRRRHPQIWSGRSAEQLGRFNPRDAGKGLHHRRAANGWADCHQRCGGSDSGSPCAPAPRL